jgi:UDP-N-acetylglucosamine 2-epimerase (non-hydrolysing)
MIAIVLGTRPEIIKFAPIIKEFDRLQTPYFIIHTGQHYSPGMDTVFFQELSLPQPKYNLEARNTSAMIPGVTNLITKKRPKCLITLGDTNSTLAGALAASRSRIPLIHLEAGLRSFDIDMAEEVNRMLADHLATYLFAPTTIAKENLQREKVSGKVFSYGNTIADVVNTYVKWQPPGNYALATIHRAENVDNPETLEDLITALDSLDMPVYLPLHPRTQLQMNAHFLKFDRVKVLPPVGYLKMLDLIQGAKVVITDSGGLQEEACILKVPCVTMRNNTERPETIELKANRLVGTEPEAIIKGVEEALEIKEDWAHPYGYKVAEKIVKKLHEL